MSYKESAWIQRDWSSFTGGMATTDGLEVVLIDTDTLEILVTMVYDTDTYQWVAGTESGKDLWSKVLSTDVFHTLGMNSLEPKIDNIRVEIRNENGFALYASPALNVPAVDLIWEGNNAFDFTVEATPSGNSELKFDDYWYKEHDSEGRWYDFRFFDKDTFDDGTKLPKFTFGKSHWRNWGAEDTAYDDSFDIPLSTSESVSHTYVWETSSWDDYDGKTHTYGWLGSQWGDLGSAFPSGLGTNKWYVEVSSWNNDYSAMFISRRTVDSLVLQTF